MISLDGDDVWSNCRISRPGRDLMYYDSFKIIFVNY